MCARIFADIYRVYLWSLPRSILYLNRTVRRKRTDGQFVDNRSGTRCFRPPPEYTQTSCRHTHTHADPRHISFRVYRHASNSSYITRRTILPFPDPPNVSSGAFDDGGGDRAATMQHHKLNFEHEKVFSGWRCWWRMVAGGWWRWSGWLSACFGWAQLKVIHTYTSDRNRLDRGMRSYCGASVRNEAKAKNPGAV